MSHRDGNGLIVGTIRNGDGVAAAGILVRAFDVGLRAEAPLGEATTDADGSYGIPPGPPGSNVRVAVIDPNGRELVSSPVRFGVDATGVIDLTLPNGSSEVSEFERYVAALAPVLQGVSLADTSTADATFLGAATGIPAGDLAGLVEASVRAGAESSAFPAEVYYGWQRQGLPLEPTALWAHTTDELTDALRRAVETGTIPARIADDLETIGTRIRQARGNGASDLGASDPSAEVPEETRELPDVTIRVRETRPGFFEADLTPTDPLHIARNGYTLDTKRGLRGRTMREVLDRAEANWAQNYPRA